MDIYVDDVTFSRSTFYGQDSDDAYIRQTTPIQTLGIQSHPAHARSYDHLHPAYVIIFDNLHAGAERSLFRNRGTQKGRRSPVYV